MMACLRFYMDDKLEAELPADSLVLGGGAPVYEREYREPAYFQKINSFNAENIPQPADLRAVAEQLISQSLILPIKDGYIASTTAWWVQPMYLPMHPVMQPSFG